MGQFTELVAYVLAAMGLTVLVVWPRGGPGAWVREKLLRKFLPKPVRGVLDCYICFGFWAGLVVAVPWWFWHRHRWMWLGCLMVSAVFWLVTEKER